MLSENPTHYHDFFENNHVITFLFNPESGEMVGSNLTEEAYLGWTKEAFENMKAKEKIFLAHSKSNRRFDFKHRLTSGEVRDVQAISGPIDVNGQQLLYSIITDITEQKKAKIEAERNASFVHTMLHLAQNFINTPLDKLDCAVQEALALVSDYCGSSRATVWKYDGQYNSAIKLYEHDKEPTIGCQKDVLRLENFEQAVDCMMRGEVWQLSCDIDAGYHEIFSETGMRSACVIPCIIEGKLSGAFSISTKVKQKHWSDIEINTARIFSQMLTSVLQRRESEEMRCQNDESYRLILDSTNDAIAMLDQSGNILNINKMFIRRYEKTRRELIGMNLKRLLPKKRYGDLCEQRLKRLGMVFDTGEPCLFEDMRDGFSLANRFYPVFKNDKVTAVTLFSTDISSRKKAEEEARSRAAHEARLNTMTDFFTNVSHDFKTPLSIILLQHELMEIYINDERKLKKLLTVAQQNSYRLTRLVANLLDITKIDAGFMKVKLENANLVALVRDICESVESYVKTKSIQLTVKSSLPEIIMPIDVEKLERILLNLLSNAIKYTKEDGSITIGLKCRKSGGAKIIVQDTGEGIPKEKQKLIFDRFAQVDTSTTRKNQGSGIGLALVKSLTETLHGSVCVKSEPGKGSKFIVELPLLPIEIQADTIETKSYDLKKRAEMELADLLRD